MCRHIIVDNPSIRYTEGPLLIAANHPNSFLDAAIIAILFKRPVYSLARGDVFKGPIIRFLLGKLNILPVYRISEGAEHLNENYNTFAICKDIFKKNGIVLIFSEGLCINEWHLRKLKKGTARIAYDSWQNDINLSVLPLGINYQSFSSFGKNVWIKTGALIQKKDIRSDEGFGHFIQSFNQKLRERLSPLVKEIPGGDSDTVIKIFHRPPSSTERYLLTLPGWGGYLLHAPLYIPLKYWVKKKVAHLGHYDSILGGLLFFTYPLYVAGLTLISYHYVNSPLVLLNIILLPFMAWSWMRIKKQF